MVLLLGVFRVSLVVFAGWFLVVAGLALGMASWCLRPRWDGVQITEYSY